MTVSTQIFTGTTVPGTIDTSSIFSNATCLYMKYTGASGLEYSMDCALQIFVSPTDQRAVPLAFDSVVDTVAVTLIPSEYIGLSMRLDIYSSAAIPVEVWTIEPDCSCKTQLDSIETKVNLLAAEAIFTTATQLIGLVVSGGVTALLPALLPGAVRGVINILNPTAEAVLIGLGKTPSTAAYDLLVPAGNDFQIPAGFTGAVNAITQSGNPASVNVTTFP